MSTEDSSATDRGFGFSAGLGALLARPVSALLFANAKDQFAPAWHWTSEEDGSYAWLQYFDNGAQSSSAKSYEGRARAVRRFTA